MRRRVLMLVFALAGAVACAGGLPVPTDETARRWPGTSRADLQRGRDLYLNRCSGCHALIQPARFPPEKWRHMVQEMSGRAKLDEHQREVVLRYLVAYARPASPS